MVKAGVSYRVTGRYMDGTNIVAYHLVGEDNSQAKETKERVLYLIGKGVISNMRVQTAADGTLIIRGKGINLNKLPVYDEEKGEFRGDDISQSAASGVSTEKSNVKDISKMGQYTITKRILFRKQCIGYAICSYDGKETRVPRDTVVKLAVDRLISNAVVNRFKNNKTGEIQLVLRGQGINLKELPVLIVDENGKIIDPETEDGSTIRIARMKNNGMLKDSKNDTSVTFESGDLIICNVNGELEIRNGLEIESNYTAANDLGKAAGDDYLEDNRYSIEIFGQKPLSISHNLINYWPILKANDF